MKRILLIHSSEASDILSLLNSLGAEISDQSTADAIVFAADCSGDFSGLITQFYKEQKPIGCFGQASLQVARALGRFGITLTCGEDSDLARSIAETGAHHELCAADDFVTDREHRVVSAPNFKTGILKALTELVEMA